MTNTVQRIFKILSFQLYWFRKNETAPILKVQFLKKKKKKRKENVFIAIIPRHRVIPESLHIISPLLNHCGGREVDT